ncbi:MAG: glycosyltransferase family 2 protein [Bacteroidaceae bacterium]|nr:glycosyltransferase family 2 protein [Bacteroidaceae bacterium]
MKDLTLAICLYNAEKYIKETLESIVAQTMQDFYLLIVNDCSTDDSIAVIEEFFTLHPRLYEIVNFEENRGIGYARHFAERKATTKYMMFLDADDILYPNAIETMYRKIKSDKDLMAVGCYLEYVNEKSKKIGGGIFLGETTKERFYKKAANKKLIFMQPTAIYDRALALSVGGYIIDGYPEGKPRYQDYCEDLDLWTRMSDLYKDGKAIIVVPEVLCKYRKIGNGLSSNSFNMIIKMRYTKRNLLLRRDGKKELTFIEFYNSLSDKELKKLKNDAKAADSLRNGVFYLKRRNIFKGAWEIMRSIYYRPGYILDKLKHNFFKKK